jgi:microcin C transport system substrate-binding protein
LPVLPEHFYDANPFDETWLAPPLGSGPYVVAAVDAPRTIRFCRAPDYWAADLPVNAGRNNFDCFTYEYFADDLVGLEAFAAGAYRMRVEFRAASWAEGYDFPAARRGWVRKVELPDGRPANAQGIWINLRRPHLQDVRLREALGYAFNFDWTNETLFHGAYTRTDSFFENTVMQAEGVPAGAELALLDPFRDALPDEVFTDPAFVPYPGAETLRDRAALRAAGRLLDAAGWTVGSDGMRRNAAGERLTLELPEDSQSMLRVLVPFQENMAALGIDLRLVTVDPTTMAERRRQFDFDLVLGAWSVESTPGAELRAYYGSEAADVEGSNNLSGLADPAVDALIEAVAEAGDRETMEVAARALDRVLRARHVWVPNWHSGTHRVAVWDVFGMPDAPAPYDFMRNLQFWWLDADKLQDLEAQGAL